MPAAGQFKRFDVREMIRQGGEPFLEIHRRVTRMKTGEGLLVIAPFLPSPLIERLDGEGFKSKLERGSGADWMVYFWRETG